MCAHVRAGADEPWQYRWQPTGCHLEPLSVASWCAALGGRNLLFVGDSLMEQTFRSLVLRLQALGDGFHARQKTTDARSTCRRTRSYTALPGCTRATELCACKGEPGGPSIIRYVSNGALDPHSDPTTKCRRCCPFNATAGPFFDEFQVFVLNTMSGDRGHVARAARDVRAVAEAAGSHPLVIYRTITLGHVGCENFSRPIETEEEALAVQRRHARYGWHDFERRSDAAARTFSKELDAITLDVRPLLLARADAHMAARSPQENGGYDCLHWCQPGPLDTLSDMLQDILRHDRRSIAHLHRFRRSRTPTRAQPSAV